MVARESEKIKYENSHDLTHVSKSEVLTKYKMYTKVVRLRKFEI